ncbi:PREDICTED: protein FATTY ACID EXPORT 1, chloroplastic-like [Camelina sativa]|uniref:Protein FATTY ACID EXPORT 1, chloroplastic-like n=1 Tax=Camelina sativa TaxID=90675 RepID=A0ABM0ZIU8_CAMSA|nr:PREDICTED: protein FATTY ACID EXPORT 1, chloroplastic-like [Camelina sativa]
MATRISQLACFSSTNRQFHFQSRSFRPQSFVVRSVDGNSSETPASLSYAAEVSKPIAEKTSTPFSTVDESATSKDIITEPVEEHVSAQPIRAAKIHDFCFGIPYGGLVISGGILGFAFSRNLTSLTTGVLYGGGLLALSTLSLKIWRQGKSCFPYILGQAVLSAVVFWKNFTAYSMTKKLVPAGLFAVVSACMLCFYSYVVLSGGNPPPKKLKPSASPSY